MFSKKLNIIKVSLSESKQLLDIGYRTFYNAFGPPHNTPENIHYYLNQKFTLEKITNEILNPESQFYFVLYDNEIAGYIKLNSGTAQTEIVDGISLEIERIYVLNAHQGKGIGRYLLDETIRIAHEKTVEFIWLGVWDQNLGAIRFYERNGFKTFNEHSFMLGSEKQTDIMMKLIL